MKEIASPYTDNYKAVATQAIRQAQNYSSFITAIYEATGIKVEVVDGLEEARLSHLGMSLHFQSQKKYIFQSTLVVVPLKLSLQKGEKIIFMTSFKLRPWH